MSVRVLRPGALSTFQDLGRVGYQHLGVPVCGAMDARAHMLANLLVGNTPEDATLEMTLTGPTLQFKSATCIAISGADLQAELNGEVLALNRPYPVLPGATLRFGARRQGARAYLAWHGGPALAPVLGSRSTCLGTGFGGLDGRALRADDHFTLAHPLRPASIETLSQAARALRLYLPAALVSAHRSTVRFLPGDSSGRAHRIALTAQARTVDAASNRMGYRLRGPALDAPGRATQLSEPVSIGTIQLPPDGQPIVLMADRQTTGGYAKLGTVISVDLPLLAQCMPGDTLAFEASNMDDAHAALERRAQAFDALGEQLREWTGMLLAARATGTAGKPDYRSRSSTDTPGSTRTP